MLSITLGVLYVWFSVEGLVSEIAQYHGLRALRLEGNTIGVEAAQAIAKALENKDQLQVQYTVLPISYNRLSVAVLPPCFSFFLHLPHCV